MLQQQLSQIVHVLHMQPSSRTFLSSPTSASSRSPQARLKKKKGGGKQVYLKWITKETVTINMLGGGLAE